MSILISALLLQAAAAPPVPPKEKLICRTIKATGSRLEQQRVCGTKAQWEVADRETQQHVRDVQDQSMIADESVLSPPSVGGGPGPR